MIFFDNNKTDIEIIRKLGVRSILVEYGMTYEIMEEGIAEYQANHPKYVAADRSKEQVNGQLGEQTPFTTDTRTFVPKSTDGHYIIQFARLKSNRNA